MDLVRLTLAANPVEAEMIRSLLSTEGIESIRKQTDFGAGTMDGFWAASRRSWSRRKTSRQPES